MTGTSPENEIDSASARRGSSRGFVDRFGDWVRRYDIEKKVAYFLIVAAVVFSVTTFLALTGDLAFAADPSGILLLLLVDFLLLLGIVSLVARRLVSLWVDRRRGTTGARLHSRLVGLFTAIALTPTTVVALFSVVFFEFGLQSWFNDKVKTSVQNALAVSEAYLFEHRQSIIIDALTASVAIGRELNSLIQNQEGFDHFLTDLANAKNLTEAVVFNQTGQVQGKAEFSFLLNFSPEIPDFALQAALKGEPVILSADTEDRVRALVYLGGFDDSFLLVGRVLDPNVLRYIDEARGAVRIYRELEGRRSGLIFTFALIFAMVSLMLLSGAVWVGLTYANALSDPLVKLIQAAERVRAGDWSARAPDLKRGDEIHSLARAFNRMTQELFWQKQDLIESNEKLDKRNRFIEVVLGGVSSGVIGVDESGVVTLANRAAYDFFVGRHSGPQKSPGGDIDTLNLAVTGEVRGMAVDAILPEMPEILIEAQRHQGHVIERQISHDQTSSGRSIQGGRVLLLRAVAECDEANSVTGYVVTFDDITELVSAQRKAAWSDVARRIAHEIKNPLTPIQLSAERLKRKYLGEISSDPDAFALCVDTIVRHASDIGRMVSEFSSFARMPAPRMREMNLSLLVREALELQKASRSGVHLTSNLPKKDVYLIGDAEQINRALTNLLLNALESVESKTSAGGSGKQQCRVEVAVETMDDRVTLLVKDTGLGLPEKERHRLTEPYVTTRTKGTGLGLAIVKKIMEDHDGYLVLMDHLGETGQVIGAQAHLVFDISRLLKRDGQNVT